MDGCYVPNNPQFGLAEPGAWGLDDMGSFSLPALDLDPLPSLLPFSPTAYKAEKQPHDMADVLLSLKHAVVHPGQTGPLSPGLGQGATYPGPSLSYTVHPHQMLSPGGGYGAAQFCDQGAFCQTAAPQQHNVFPSMSVNVSMNMTMHGYPPDNMACSQMQWATPGANTSPVYPQAQALLSPQGYGGGTTYSFTADFRPPQPPPQVVPSPMVDATARSMGGTGVVGLGPRASPRRFQTPNSKMSASMTLSATSPTQQVLDESHRPNLCRICGKTYARPSTLKTHLRTHSGEKPYRCGDCHKSFSQAANLTAHVRTHSGEKPFRCAICDRRFSQSSSVTTHMRTHSGERPYRCRLCRKAFSDSSTLTKHLRIHSGEKPYQCKLCLLRFSQSGNLNRHMRVHGGGGAA